MPNGIETAAPLVPAAFGILSVADVRRTSSDEDWVRGFSAEFNSRPQLIRILTRSTGLVDDGTVYDADEHQIAQYEVVDPFFIELVYKGSLLGSNINEQRVKAAAQLDAATGKAVEYELWNGVAVKADGIDQSYLTVDGDLAATVLGTGGVSPKKALSLIEGAIADSPTGAGGVIHVTRDIGSILTLQGAIKPVDDHLETVLGTKVVIGSGYTGDGPGDSNEASDTTKWMYATGPVSVLLGDAEVVNEDSSRSVNTSVNDINLAALRPASVYFDPSIFYAVQITIPDAP